MNDRVTNSAFGSLEKFNQAYSIYIREIDFHNDILEYGISKFQRFKTKNKLALCEYFRVAQFVNNIMELIIITMTLTCTLIIALSLFVVEVNCLRVETLFAFINITLIMMIMFTYCLLSERITSDLLEIGDVFYNSEWYRLPFKEQRLLVLPIGRAQRVFRLSGLGLITCSLAVFLTVKSFYLPLFLAFLR